MSGGAFVPPAGSTHGSVSLSARARASNRRRVPANGPRLRGRIGYALVAGRTHARSPWWLAALAIAACTSGPAEPGSAAAGGVAPAAEPAPGPDDWFVERAAATGLDFVHFNGMSGEFYAPEMMPAGVGLLDYDNDGDLDAYFVQGQIMGEGRTLADALFAPVGPLPPRGRLYRNDLDVDAGGTRTLRFTDVTAESGVDARGHGMGVASGDVDNDGNVDLYLANLGPNRLYRNNGDGSFTDVSAASGTDDPGWGRVGLVRGLRS